ncbi:hypothetical protein [Raoultella planticola]
MQINFENLTIGVFAKAAGEPGLFDAFQVAERRRVVTPQPFA